MPQLLCLFAVCLVLASSSWVYADQTERSATCDQILQALWTVASDACIGKPTGYICNGGSAPIADPVGPVSNALASVGALVETSAVSAMRTPLIDVERNIIGIAWLRMPDSIGVTALLIGDVTVWNVAPPDFPAWQSLVAVTSSEASLCPAAPANVLLLQSGFGQAVRLVVNGVSVILNGSVIVRTVDSTTIFAEISGRSSIIVYGQEQQLLTGQQISVRHSDGDFTRPGSAETQITLLDPAALRSLPVALFDRPLLLPQPGFVRTQGEVNLRSSASRDAGIVAQIPAGEVMNILGSSPDTAWYHVRRDTGETGWILAELVVASVGEINAIYESTPTIPQRYGQLGTTGQIVAPAGASLRQGPDTGFPVIASVADATPVELLARSPYSPWVLVDANGTVGWIALIALDTRAFFDAIPIDYSVPPPPPTPTPTRVPGSFGNAFPEPGSGVP
jgi:uncharacterized protein YraI